MCIRDSLCTDNAVFGVNGDTDLFIIQGQKLFDKAKILYCLCADDNAADADIHIHFCNFFVADTAAQFNRDVERFDNILDNLQILGLSVKGAVKVYEMQIFSAFGFPALSDLHRVVEINGFIVLNPLLQADTFSDVYKRQVFACAAVLLVETVLGYL